MQVCAYSAGAWVSNFGLNSTGAPISIPLSYFYKDTTPTQAGAWGMSIPGGSLTNDFIGSVYNAGAWSKRSAMLQAGGFAFYNASSTQIGEIDNSGNETLSGSMQAVGLIQPAAKTYAGTCAMAAGTTCTLTIATGFTAPSCVATAQGTGAAPPAAACSDSAGTVTVTAASSNSLTWAVLVMGNPN